MAGARGEIFSPVGEPAGEREGERRESGSEKITLPTVKINTAKLLFTELFLKTSATLKTA